MLEFVVECRLGIENALDKALDRSIDYPMAADYLKILFKLEYRGQLQMVELTELRLCNKDLLALRRSCPPLKPWLPPTACIFLCALSGEIQRL